MGYVYRLPPLPPANLPRAATGAGEGNRTLVVSLEGFCSTIELHPQTQLAPPSPTRNRCVERAGGGGWIRTSVLVRGQIYSLLPLTTRPPLRGEPESLSRQSANCEPPCDASAREIDRPVEREVFVKLREIPGRLSKMPIPHERKGWPVGRQRRRVVAKKHEMPIGTVPDKLRFSLRVRSPEQKHLGRSMPGCRRDEPIRQMLPSALGVTAGGSSFDGQARVEQQHALRSPVPQVPT